MALKTKTLQREFFLDGRRIADPNPALTIDEVRNHYAGTYPALNNAAYEEETTSTAVKITFKTAIGTKG